VKYTFEANTLHSFATSEMVMNNKDIFVGIRNQELGKQDVNWKQTLDENRQQCKEAKECKIPK